MFRRWRRARRRRAEVAQELAAHLACEIAENIGRGMTLEQAGLAARRKLGNLTTIREAVYEMSTLGGIDSIYRDLRYGLRQLRSSPGFSLVAIASLALGIGANTAIFQLLDAVRLRALPVSRPGEIAQIRIDGEEGRNGNFRGRNGQFTNAVWEQIRDGQEAFSGVLAFGDTVFNLSAAGEVRNVDAMWVSGSFFATLGVRPVIGRLIGPQDDRRGCANPPVAISYALWQREFGGSPDVLSKTLPGDRGPLPIAGVMPPEFFGVEVGRRFDVALPVCAAAGNLDDRMLWWLSVMGRLKPGWSIEKARAHLASLSASVFEATVPPSLRGEAAQAYRELRLKAVMSASGVSPLRASYERPLIILMAMVGFVLLIACANLANMMLARAATREQEFAVRLSIGASRGRLIQQLLTESLILSLFGAAAGVFLASALSRFMVAMLSTPRDPIFLDLATDWRTLGFTAGLACVTCLAFGLAPAFRAGQVSAGIRSGGRGLTANRDRLALRRVLLAAQVALCLVLLTGALLFAQTLRNLIQINPGFRQDGLLVANTFLLPPGYTPERRDAVRRSLLERLQAIPGVSAVAYGYVTPVSGSSWNRLGRVAWAGTERAESVWLNAISTGYFNVMQTPLLAGRDFDDRDIPAAPKVAIVNEAFAQHFFDGANPVGKTFRMMDSPGMPEAPFEIVGLAANSKYISLREPFSPVAFLAASQESPSRPVVRYLLRTQGSAEALVSPVTRVIAEVDPTLSVRFAVLKTLLRESLIPERLMATLSGFFGLLAAIIAMVGLYGVVSYMVARRYSEIGIRMALGAGRGSIVRMILTEVGILMAAGLAAGVALSIAAARGAQTMFFGLHPGDPATIATAVFGLAAVGFAAAWLPARRAANTEPAAALRQQ